MPFDYAQGTDNRWWLSGAEANNIEMKMLLKGNKHIDDRGTVKYNNDFDASPIKRIYTIENHSTDFIRGWQGHKIEQRWFAAVKGSFEISVIEIDHFEKPSRDLKIKKYELDDKQLTYLHVPGGHVTAIQAKEKESKLLVLADFAMGEIDDEFRYDINYFN